MANNKPSVDSVEFGEYSFLSHQENIPKRLSVPVVYVLDMIGTPYVKVGSTANIKSRLYGLQTATPFLVELHFYLCPNRAMSHILLEKSSHQILKESHVRGEWFECSAHAASKAIMQANKLMNGATT